jgi:hypothetical protein
MWDLRRQLDPNEDSAKRPCSSGNVDLPMSERHRKRMRPRSARQVSSDQSTSSISLSAASMWKSLFFLALVNSGSMTSQGQTTNGSTRKCTTFMALSDSNRDMFMSTDEYVTFVNYLSDQYYGNVTFEQLPEELTTNFEVWAGSDLSLGIEGSYPGASQTAYQAERLESICYDTRTVLSVITTPAPSRNSSQTPTIAPTPDTTILKPVDKSFSDCRTAMAVSDLSRDNELDPQEYVRFISFMSENQFQFTEYDDLPELLRFNFATLSKVNSVSGIRSMNITGSAPGTNLADLTPEIIANLENKCQQTQNAVNTVTLFGLPASTTTTTPGETISPVVMMPATTEGPSTEAPILDIILPPRPPINLSPSIFLSRSPLAESTFPTVRPTNSFEECRLSIAFSDRNRDNLINETEYVEVSAAQGQ